MMELREKIEQAITEEPVASFMKGTPQRVMCGNSLRALEALHRRVLQSPPSTRFTASTITVCHAEPSQERSG